jgi:hypothetical protein
MGARVFWTANRVWLREGEPLLTDGRRHIRARCGNRISDVPLQPVSPLEPTGTELETVVALLPSGDLPVTTAETPERLLAATPVWIPPGGTFTPPPHDPPPPEPPPPSPPPPGPPVEVSEPGLLALGAGGVLAMVIRRFVRSRRPREVPPRIQEH